MEIKRLYDANHKITTFVLKYLNQNFFVGSQLLIVN